MTRPMTLADHRPFVRGGYIALVIGMGGFLTWANLAEISSAVVAPGTVVVASNRKTIQHLEGGIIGAVDVSDGKSVRAGEVLIRLDQTQASANLEAINVQLNAARATEVRLVAERLGNGEMDVARLSSEGRGGDANPLADQVKLFETRKASLSGQIDIMDARIEQLRKKASGWGSKAGFLREEVRNFQEQLDGLSGLVERGLHPKNAAREIERRIASLQGEIAEATAEEASALSMIAETRLQKEQTVYQFREKASEELAKVRESVAGLVERRDVARDVLERTNIRSPQDGVVQGLRFHAKGEVLRPGDAMLEIVPVNDELLVEVQVPAGSIDRVEPGLETEIRFPNFSARDTPVIMGRVTKVSADAIPDKDGQRHAFLGRIEVLKDGIPRDLARRLQPGMPAEAFVTNGSRTVMSYLLKPLKDSMHRGLRER